LGSLQILENEKGNEAQGLRMGLRRIKI